MPGSLWLRLPVEAGHAQKLLRGDADRGAGRTGADTGRSAVDPGAHIAFDRFFGLLDPRPAVLVAPFLRRLARPRPHAEQQPAQDPRLGRRHAVHADHAVRAVALAIAAADAGLVNEDFAVRSAMDRVGRAIRHAMRVLAMPAAGRHMEMRIGPACLAIE